MIFESVINISVGDDVFAFNSIYDSVLSQKSMIDVHRDVDHNRSVFTIASNNLQDVISTTEILISSSFKTIDFSIHKGEHPRIGIVDVVPFIKYDEEKGEIDYESDLTFKQQIYDYSKELNSTFDIPIFLYDYASIKEKISLPQIRKNAFVNLNPSIGNNTPHPMYGAIALGIRKPLIAINVNLETTDINCAKEISKSIRESDGGYTGVRALGIDLKSQNCVQVSMNIVDLSIANAGEVCLKVKELAEKLGIHSEVELVGLIPKYHFETFNKKFLTWSKLDVSSTIEYRLEKYKENK